MNRGRERFVESPDLVLATDHPNRRETARTLVVHFHEPPRANRVALALELDRRQRLDVDGIPNVRKRRLAEEDLAGPGTLLEPSCDVDCVAGREPLVGSGDDLARIDPDPHRKDRSVVARKPVIQRTERLPQAGRCPDRAQGIVLVEDRNAEDRHHRVADEFLHASAVALDHVRTVSK